MFASNGRIGSLLSLDLFLKPPERLILDYALPRDEDLFLNAKIPSPRIVMMLWPADLPAVLKLSTGLIGTCRLLVKQWIRPAACASVVSALVGGPDS